MKEHRSVLIGSLVAGVLASACCIGPLVLGVLGLGSLGLGAALAPLRPWFLGATAAFLTIGFYFAYRPLPAAACASDGSCASPISRRNQRIALWMVTALAAGFATYPAWGAATGRAWSDLRGTAPTSAGRPTAATTGGEVVTLAVSGMTCSACTGEIEASLRKVSGVRSAQVDYAHGRATVLVSDSAPKPEVLVKVVEEDGYHAVLMPSKSAPNLVSGTP